ncbi:ubiquinone biosynthesis O-methyltransferase, mitochondrial [Protopterus annectens]|uniref:ubiquinone biosynthesis O-methyltransferase, mitochondrial n=1 Tax=Protopterus annectens TaxID=7888 RepID=UPI001CFAF81B|nr:ubiquinone biosynthesis O-methyltransferase, mitochondrial [Protopterus annectens]
MMAKRLLFGADCRRKYVSVIRNAICSEIHGSSWMKACAANVQGRWPKVENAMERLPTSVSAKIPFKRRMCSTFQSTIDQAEIKKFQSLAQKWWDENGEFQALHTMNDLRVPFIRDTLINYIGSRQSGSPLSGVRLLDVGCGGGLLSEPLARLGAVVTGLDPVEDNIRTAEVHKSPDPFLNKQLQYKACSLEDITEECSECFDAIVASEVLEHVADRETFINCCYHVLKPSGHLFITTINKTNLSYLIGIIAAEWIFSIVPRGTHEWEKFVIPEELERQLESNGFYVESINGMYYNICSGLWSWTESTSINYALHAVKSKDTQHPESENPVSEETIQSYANSAS